MLMILLTIIGSVYSITDDFIDVVLDLSGELLIGFEGEIWDDLAYQIIIATNIDAFADDNNDDSEDISISTNLMSFFGLGGVCVAILRVI